LSLGRFVAGTFCTGSVCLGMFCLGTICRSTIFSIFVLNSPRYSIFERIPRILSIRKDQFRVFSEEKTRRGAEGKRHKERDTE
jgi:hypothetical protein